MNFRYCDSDIYSLEGCNYLFDCYSFEILKVSDESLPFIKSMISDTSEFSLKGANFPDLASIIIAMQQGHFFRKNKIGEVTYKLSQAIPVISFTPIHKCNLACTYCFAKSGNNYTEDQKVLENTTIENMFCFIHKFFKTKEKIRIEFVGGGEPLLHKETLQSIAKILREQARENKKRYMVQLITNGTLLGKEEIYWLDKNNFNIGVSIDGDKIIQDSQRVFKDGKGTYDIVLKNIEQIKAMDDISVATKDIWAVSVLTSSCKSIYDVIKHHRSIGIRSLEIRVARGSEENLELLNEETLPHYKKIYFDLMCDLLNDVQQEIYDNLLAIANNYDTFGKLIKRIINKEKVIYRCGAGKWKFACSANGKIYPCDSFVGNSDFIIADVNSGYINEKIISDFINVNVHTCLSCGSCNCRYLCGGDCYFNCFINNGDIKDTDTSFCKLNKYLCTLAIHFVYELRKHKEVFLKIRAILKARELTSI